jgi:F0F1-type ATP synthase assembly protein I
MVHKLQYKAGFSYSKYKLTESSTVITLRLISGVLLGKAIGYNNFNPVFTSYDGGNTFSQYSH